MSEAALLELWIAAYRVLERDFSRLDLAWQQKHSAVLAENHRLSAQINDHAIAEATTRVANEETGCPF